MGFQPGTSQAYLIKWPESVYKHPHTMGQQFIFQTIRKPQTCGLNESDRKHVLKLLALDGWGKTQRVLLIRLLVLAPDSPPEHRTRKKTPQGQSFSLNGEDWAWTPADPLTKQSCVLNKEQLFINSPPAHARLKTTSGGYMCNNGAARATYNCYTTTQSSWTTRQEGTDQHYIHLQLRSFKAGQWC